MIVFWTIAALMMMVAVGFAVRPLLRRDAVSANSRDDLNVVAARQQLHEMARDVELGALDAHSYAEARGDLERELIDSLAGQQNVAAPKPRPRLVATLVVLLPLIAGGLYGLLGAGTLVAEPAATPPTAAQGGAMPHSVEDMVAGLAQRLAREPDDVAGWTMLGRSYVFLHRPQEALAAYAHAYQLAGDSDAGLLVDYADALASANQNRIEGQAAELLAKATARDPANLKAQWLTAVMHYQRGEFEPAVLHFETASKLVAPGSDDARALAEQLQAARQHLDPAAAAAASAAAVAAEHATPAGASAAPGVSLPVSIEVAPALAAQVAAGDAVFVFARAVQGPRIPLAIVKRSAAELPFSVQLDDTLAMSPQLRLSGFERVDVTARVSHSGDATPKSGDLIGTVSGVAVRAGAPVKLVIDHVQP